MLEEIRQADIVEEFSAPVLSLQLVLTTPHCERPPGAGADTDLTKTATSQSSYLKNAFLEGTGSTKKTVKFEPEHSGELEICEWLYIPWHKILWVCDVKPLNSYLNSWKNKQKVEKIINCQLDFKFIV